MGTHLVSRVHILGKFKLNHLYGFLTTLYLILQDRRLREEISIKMAERYDCTDCKESLYGQKYILKEENPYCIKCYEALYSNNCELCKVLIGCTSKVKTFIHSFFIQGFQLLVLFSLHTVFQSHVLVFKGDVLLDIYG